MVARYLGVVEAVGSSPAIRTNAGAKFALLRRFFVEENHSLGEWFKKRLMSIMKE